jgi:drug/metabolite transporter (DMT)-like permease
MALALAGLVLVLDVFGGVRIDLVGVLWGLLAAFGLASYFLMSGHAAKVPLPPLVLAGGGMVVASLGFALLGATGLLPMSFSTDAAQFSGWSLPWWASVAELAVLAAATPYLTGIVATRVLGAKLASFVGLSEVMFTVLLAWLLLGELPRPVQLVGGLFILAGVVAVRSEEPRGPAEAVGGPTGPSEVEPRVAVQETLRGDVPVVAHDRVELDRVDVAAAQDLRGPVGTVQQHGPV